MKELEKARKLWKEIFEHDLHENIRWDIAEKIVEMQKAYEDAIKIEEAE